MMEGTVMWQSDLRILVCFPVYIIDFDQSIEHAQLKPLMNNNQYVPCLHNGTTLPATLVSSGTYLTHRLMQKLASLWL